MYNIRQIWKFVCFDFRQWRHNPRVAMTFLLAFVLCLMLSDKAISFASSYGTIMQIFETFVWTFGDADSIMISSLLLILLFADMPFITQATPYYLARSRRSSWVWGQVCYVVLATIAYAVFLVLVTCLLCAHLSFTGNKWSETGAMLGYSGVGSKIALPASVKTMEMSHPYQCTAAIFLLIALYSLLLAMVMLLLNLYRGQFLGILSVFGINLYGLFLNPEIFMKLFQIPEALKYKANVAVGWLSPLNHATYYMHNFGYDYLPRLWMSVLIFLGCIGMNLFLINRRVKKYEFDFIQMDD